MRGAVLIGVTPWGLFGGQITCNWVWNLILYTALLNGSTVAWFLFFAVFQLTPLQVAPTMRRRNTCNYFVDLAHVCTDQRALMGKGWRQYFSHPPSIEIKRFSMRIRSQKKKCLSIVWFDSKNYVGENERAAISIPGRPISCCLYPMVVGVILLCRLSALSRILRASVHRGVDIL